LAPVVISNWVKTKPVSIPDIIITGQISEQESTPIVKLLSYADDLEVFLSNPSEWPILRELLSIYGLASNAKVNIQKTVIILSGTSHPEWIDIAANDGFEWYDAQSSSALRYLGYPLYHNDQQLLSYLNEVKLKISQHANFLRGRHLSIRGTSLVAKAILLGGLWHLLRVTSVPPKWLKEIKAIVRNFVMPFWPKPSFSTVSRPKMETL
jgi:hypothetical protein